MDDVELVVELRDDALVRWAGIDIGEVLGRRLAIASDGGALPILTALPDVPLAVGIEAVEHVGAQRHRLVEVEFQRILDLLEDVLGKDPDTRPPHREIGVEARVGLLQLEDHRLGVWRFDGCYVAGEHGRKPHRRILDLDIDGRLDVGRAELDPVAPEDAPAQLYAHFREVGIVDRLVRREGVVPGAIEALLRVDVPQRIQGILLQAIRLAAGIDCPDVEPAGILDRPLWILEDDEFFAGNVLGNSLGARWRKCARQGRQNARSQQHCTNALHRFLLATGAFGTRFETMVVPVQRDHNAVSD